MKWSSVFYTYMHSHTHTHPDSHTHTHTAETASTADRNIRNPPGVCLGPPVETLEQGYPLSSVLFLVAKSSQPQKRNGREVGHQSILRQDAKTLKGLLLVVSFGVPSYDFDAKPVGTGLASRCSS